MRSLRSSAVSSSSAASASVKRRRRSSPFPLPPPSSAAAMSNAEVRPPPSPSASSSRARVRRLREATAAAAGAAGAEAAPALPAAAAAAARVFRGGIYFFIFCVFRKETEEKLDRPPSLRLSPWLLPREPPEPPRRLQRDSKLRLWVIVSLRTFYSNKKIIPEEGLLHRVRHGHLLLGRSCHRLPCHRHGSLPRRRRRRRRGSLAPRHPSLLRSGRLGTRRRRRLRTGLRRLPSPSLRLLPRLPAAAAASGSTPRPPWPAPRPGREGI